MRSIRAIGGPRNGEWLAVSPEVRLGDRMRVESRPLSAVVPSFETVSEIATVTVTSYVLQSLHFWRESGLPREEVAHEVLVHESMSLYDAVSYALSEWRAPGQAEETDESGDGAAEDRAPFPGAIGEYQPTPWQAPPNLLDQYFRDRDTYLQRDVYERAQADALAHRQRLEAGIARAEAERRAAEEYSLQRRLYELAARQEAGDIALLRERAARRGDPEPNHNCAGWVNWALRNSVPRNVILEAIRTWPGGPRLEQEATAAAGEGRAPDSGSDSAQRVSPQQRPAQSLGDQVLPGGSRPIAPTPLGRRGLHDVY